MKKILFLLAVLPMVLFTSCSKDNDEKDGNALIGSKYVHKNSNNNYDVIEFTGKSTFILYITDMNMNVLNDSKTGSYSLSDNDINFNEFVYRESVLTENKLKHGTVNSNLTISINFEWRNYETDNSGKWHESTDNLIFTKK